MKLKQACYDPAFCRMGAKRFAPLGILYTLALVLFTVGTVNLGQNMHSTVVTSFYSFFQDTLVFNFAYAFVLVQLLLGDLYTPRLCYAIHSLPVTRGGWFGTQVIQGILSVIPGILISGGLMAVSVTRFRILIPVWMGISMLQFLFFFGAALLCGVCAGNRIGMAVLYGILNFAALFVAWARMKIFSPLIYGMYIPDASTRFCPIFDMANSPIFQPQYSQTYVRNVIDGPTAYFDSREILSIEFSAKGIWLTVFFAALGCLAIFLAVRLLQRRKPECAGDLLAFPIMKPVILVLCTLFSGIVFHAVSSLFEWSMGYLMLAIGLVVGYYGCLMLLKRQVNVFTGKSFLPLAVVGAVVLLAFTGTGLDLCGIAYRMPEASQVEKAELRIPYIYSSTFTATEAAEIESILTLQRDALEEHRQREAARPVLERIFGSEEETIEYEKPDGTLEKSGRMYITYTLKNGSTVNRSYQYHETSPHLEILQKIFSQPEFVFSNYDDFRYTADGGFDALLERTNIIQVRCWHDGSEYAVEKSFNITSPADWQGLMDAMLADCEDANLGQTYSLHPDDTYRDRINIYYQSTRVEGSDCLSVDVYTDCENTLNWLIDHGYHDEITD
ncbi:MAG: hypothetical protein ACI3XG_11945 [Faecousia sp.]